jgi:galactokinase
VAGTSRVKAWRAPGRVNLIGEHTDYNAGFVLPAAISLECTIRVRPSRKKELTVHSREMNAEVAWPLESISGLTPQGHWTDYVIGVVHEVLALGHPVFPAKLEISSTVPAGSGLSSSAALEVATALAVLGGQPLEKLELARLCQRAERNFVGMPCGIMDQYASVFGVDHSAILIDCRSLEHEVVPIPAGVEIVAVNTMVKHELGQSAYRERVAECTQALSYFPGKESLRDVTLGELERAAHGMPEIPLARARHVVLEDLRVQEFLKAARTGDTARMGKLFVESHRSLQHDYQVSCAELDYLVDTALTLPGVIGARMTGGGFGGCTVNLVESGQVSDFEAAISGRYEKQYRIRPAVYRCRPSAGAGPA